MKNYLYLSIKYLSPKYGAQLISYLLRFRVLILCPFLLLPKQYSRNESCIYCWTLVYILANSLLQGDPRYLMGTYFVLVLALVRLVFLIKDSDVLASQAKLSQT